jgi:hypothetical protein
MQSAHQRHDPAPTSANDIDNATLVQGAPSSPGYRLWNILPIRERILAQLRQAEQAAELVLNKSTFHSAVKLLYASWNYRKDVLDLAGSYVSCLPKL